MTITNIENESPRKLEARKVLAALDAKILRGVEVTPDDDLRATRRSFRYEYLREVPCAQFSSGRAVMLACTFVARDKNHHFWAATVMGPAAEILPDTEFVARGPFKLQRDAVECARNLAIVMHTFPVADEGEQQAHCHAFTNAVLGDIFRRV